MPASEYEADRIEKAACGGDPYQGCLLYTSDAADDLLCVDLGGRRIIKKKTTTLTDTTPLNNQTI